MVQARTAFSTWCTLSRRFARARYEVVRPTLIDTGGDLFATTPPNGLNWLHHEWSRTVTGEASDAAGWRASTLGARGADGVLVREPHPLENLGIRASGFMTTARGKVDAITALQMLIERGMPKTEPADAWQGNAPT